MQATIWTPDWICCLPHVFVIPAVFEYYMVAFINIRKKCKGVFTCYNLKGKLNWYWNLFFNLYVQIRTNQLKNMFLRRKLNFWKYQKSWHQFNKLSSLKYKLHDISHSVATKNVLPVYTKCWKVMALPEGEKKVQLMFGCREPIKSFLTTTRE